jgi:hypothetical protein
MQINPVGVNNITSFGRKSHICHENCNHDNVQTTQAAQTSQEPKRNKALIPILAVATSAAILATLTLISRGKAGKGKIAKFLNETAKIGKGEKAEYLFKIEKFNMFKPKTYSTLVNTASYGSLDVIAMAGASTATGLAVGCALDGKEHRKTKLKEAVSQMVGNIILPIVCVTAGGILATKALNTDVLKSFLNRASKPKAMESIFRVVTGVASFAVGCLGGNKIANKLNKAVFKTQTPPRPFKIQDASAHIDDGTTMIGMVGKGVGVCDAIARVVPAALTISGISAGLAREKEEGVGER